MPKSLLFLCLSASLVLAGCTDMMVAMTGINRCDLASDVGSTGCIQTRSGRIVAMNCEAFTREDGTVSLRAPATRANANSLERVRP